MKLVFYKSGDSLNLEPNRAKVITKWFEYLFDNNINDKYFCNHSTCNRISDKIEELNNTIFEANQFISDKTNSEATVFEFSDGTLDQNFLNKTHKKWVYLTDKYKNQIFPQPSFWHNVNHYVHDIEQMFSADFRNENENKLWALPEEYRTKINPEDCTYVQNDLVLSFRDLGRHQHNQWLLGSDLDSETNNYKTVSLDFGFRHYTDQGPDYTSEPLAPQGYIDWCKERNIEALPPWISVGKFTKYDRYNVRKLFYKNLSEESTIGFEL